MDWFFGFKLHLVVNEVGQLLNATLTAGNVDHRQPVTSLVQNLFGKIFADRGYVWRPAIISHSTRNHRHSETTIFATINRPQTTIIATETTIIIARPTINATEAYIF